jgi:hypothetical protein
LNVNNIYIQKSVVTEIFVILHPLKTPIMLENPTISKTTQVVREAMRIVSKDVRMPKIVREGKVQPSKQATKQVNKK